MAKIEDILPVTIPMLLSVLEENQSSNCSFEACDFLKGSHLYKEGFLLFLYRE